MNANLPPLPDGFQLDTVASPMPPLPQGFVLDSANNNSGDLPQPQHSYWSNVGRGVADRGLNLVGQLGQFVDTMAAPLEEKFPLGGIAWDGGLRFVDQNEMGQVRDIGDVGTDLVNLDTGYKPTHTWESTKAAEGFGDTLSEGLAYVGEAGPQSIADMIGAYAASVPYIASRSQEIGTARAENKGMEQAGAREVLEAMPAAVVVQQLEKLLPAMLPDMAGQGIVKTATKAAGVEAGTEALQTAVPEYLGERLGTGADMSIAEAIDQAMGAALVGGGVGGSLGTVTGVAGGAAKTPDETPPITDQNLRDMLNDQPAFEPATAEQDVAAPTSTKIDLPPIDTSQFQGGLDNLLNSNKLVDQQATPITPEIASLFMNALGGNEVAGARPRQPAQVVDQGGTNLPPLPEGFTIDPTVSKMETVATKNVQQGQPNATLSPESTITETADVETTGDPLIDGAKTYPTKDKFSNYIRGRLGKTAWNQLRQSGELDRVWNEQNPTQVENDGDTPPADTEQSAFGNDQTAATEVSEYDVPTGGDLPATTEQQASNAVVESNVSNQASVPETSGTGEARSAPRQPDNQADNGRAGGDALAATTGQGSVQPATGTTPVEATEQGDLARDTNNNRPAATGQRTDVQGQQEQLAQSETSGQLDDFGEKIGGARKDLAKLLTPVTDADVSTKPLSKTWPKKELDAIEDTRIAAFATAARATVPNKPRMKGKVNRWVEKVQTLRQLTHDVLEEGNPDRVLEKMKGISALRDLAVQIEAMADIDRSQWSRLGAVEVYDDAYTFDHDGERESDGSAKKIPKPHTNVTIDGRRRRYEGKFDHDAVVKFVNEQLAASAPEQKTKAGMKFEIRRSRAGGETPYFINKVGDRDYTELKSFASLEEARAFQQDNVDELVTAWEAVKARENVTKSDMRSKEERPRVGGDHRQGKDVTPEMFTEAFGFRGVEFGNWVKQGSKGNDRQGMLNKAYDALLDLADILDIPTQAISLNGELGLALGARGKGKFAAHYEPGHVVINLTKTQGAGSLAHEWFHALDNYFQKKRTGSQPSDDFITQLPETFYVSPKGYRLSETRFNSDQVRIPNRDEWTKKTGVRPEMAAMWVDLVKALNKSPMNLRTQGIDGGKKNAYWSSVIERGARSFENYIIAKMQDKGYHNDFLANVTRFEDFKRNPEKYPYLKDDELPPVVEAFDQLFDVMESRETDQGVELFNKAKSPKVYDTVSTDIAQKIVNAFMAKYPGTDDLKINVSEDSGDWYKESGIKGGYSPKTNTLFLATNAHESEADVTRTLQHELFVHKGLGLFKPVALRPLLDKVKEAVANDKSIKAISDEINDTYSNITESEHAEEVLARLAENLNADSKLSKWVNNMLVALRRLLQKIGFIKPGASKAELIKLLQFMADAFKDGRRTIPRTENKREGVQPHGVQLNRQPIEVNVTFGDIDTRGNIPPDQQNLPPDDSQAKDSFTRKMIDRTNPVRYVLQDKLIDLKKVQRGHLVNDDENAYEKADVWESRLAYRLNELEEDHVIPIIETIESSGLTIEEVGSYLQARHIVMDDVNKKLAEDNEIPFNADVALAGMTNRAAEMVLAEHESNSHIKQLVDMVEAMNREKMDVAVEHGLLSRGEANGWIEKYPHWIPLKRQVEGDDRITPPPGQGFQVRGKESQRRAGSDLALNPEEVLAEMVGGFKSTLRRAEKAEVGKAFFRFASDNPKPDFYDVDNEEALERDADGQVINRFVVKFDGEEHFVTFNTGNEEAMRAMRGLKNLDNHMPSYLKAFSWFNRLESNLNTMLNPEFWITNAFRDVQTGAFNLSDTQLKNVEGKVIKSYFSAAKGIATNQWNHFRDNEQANWAEIYEDFKQQGAKVGWADVHRDITQQAKALDKKLKDAQVLNSDGKLAGKAWVRNKQAWQGIFGFIGNVNDVFENAIRLSAYKHALDAGVSKQQAAALAKNLTVNFNRKGTAGPAINALWLFYNAAIQGNVRMMQAIYHSKKLRTMLMGTVGLHTLLDMFNRLLAPDDDDGENLYDSLPTYVKNHNIIIWDLPVGGDGSKRKEPLIKFAMPWGYNVFGVMGQEIGKSITGRRDVVRSGGRLMGAIADAYNPVGGGTVAQMLAPTVLDPFVMANTEKAWHGGPLMPKNYGDLAPKPDSERYFSTARQQSIDVAKYVNDMTGGTEIEPGWLSLSPETLDVFIDLSGGAGRFLFDTVSAVDKGIIQDKGLETKEVPFLRKFTGGSAEYALRSRYWDYAADMEYAKKASKQLKGPAAAKEFVKPRHKLIDKYSESRKALRKLSKERKKLIKAGQRDSLAYKVNEQKARLTMARFNRLYAQTVLDK